MSSCWNYNLSVHKISDWFYDLFLKCIALFFCFVSSTVLMHPYWFLFLSRGFYRTLYLSNYLFVCLSVCLCECIFIKTSACLKQSNKTMVFCLFFALQVKEFVSNILIIMYCMKGRFYHVNSYNVSRFFFVFCLIFLIACLIIFCMCVCVCLHYVQYWLF